MLEGIFGKEFFPPKVTERIKTYEDACNELSITPIDVKALLSKGFTKDEIAYRKIKDITRALNEGWKPDWNDEDQKKWIPLFYTDFYSGLVLYDTDYECRDVHAGYGLYLCFKNEELAAYAGKQFIDLYKEFIL